MSENPWSLETVAIQQRALVDRQLQEWSEPNGRRVFDGTPRRYPHFDALVAAVRSTNNAGSLLEIGCGSGYGREILDRAGVEYREYAGVDINETAIRIAKERYPESQWLHADAGAVVASRQADTVIDGSALLHIGPWREHLAHLCGMTRRWLILHRVPITTTPAYRRESGGVTETHQRNTAAYGQVFPAWRFNPDDVINEMSRLGFVQTASFPADGETVTMVFARPRHFVSYADGAYLGRLKALHASMLRHCQPFVLHVLAWSDDVYKWGVDAPSVIPGDVVGFLDEHPMLALDALPGPPRTKVEHYWTCGPQWIADCMEATGEPCTYVDSDVMFHASPEQVFAEIGGARTGLVEHGFAPVSAGLPGPTQDSHDIFGRYNCGIVHLADVILARRWAEQCRAWCYDRLEKNPRGLNGDVLYGDQAYLESYDEVAGGHAITHPGACPGPWGIHTRSLDIRDGVIHFGGRPLVAYHYSSLREIPDGAGYVASRPEYALTQRQMEILYLPYIAALNAAKEIP